MAVRRDPAFKVILSTVRIAGAVGAVAFAAQAVTHKIASLFGHWRRKAVKGGEERGEKKRGGEERGGEEMEANKP